MSYKNTELNKVENKKGKRNYQKPQLKKYKALKKLVASI